MRDPATLPRAMKATIVLATDALLLPSALWMAFGFRLGPFDPASSFGVVDPLAWVGWIDILVIWIGSFCVLAAFRLHRIKLHAMDIDAVRRIAVCSAAVGLYAAIASFFLRSGFPRSIPVLYGASFFLLAVSIRIAALRFFRTTANFSKTKTPVAIYGAGAAGIQLAASLKQSHELEPVMFVDDNPALQNVIVAGIRVKPPAVLSRAASEQRIRQVLIAIPSLIFSRKEALARELRDIGLEVKVIPSYVDLVSGRETVDSLSIINTDDLLGRDKVDLDAPEIRATYAGRAVMVTGAGGSIGSELCRQVLQCKPKSLILFERSENALYEIERRLRDEFEKTGVHIHPVLGSVTDRKGVDAVLETNRVDVVLHAAAYKHVPMVETNEVEGARNNVLGTQTMVAAALDAKLERFILISTDKAVRPTNVMGATKALAEMVIHGAQRRKSNTVFSIVRFGNVLGSSGSVVPLFAEQIAAGGPVTVTHPEVTRFFMTIPEASRLVLLAGAYADGDDLFVLDMGKPIKIVDLAERMIKLSGRTIRNDDNPNGDIVVEVTGLRPGEKLFEEVLVDANELISTPHAKILRAKTTGFTPERTATMELAVEDAVSRRDRVAIRSIASAYVEGFESQPRDAEVLQFSKANARN